MTDYTDGLAGLEKLTLPVIDSGREMTASEHIVAAVAFAVRAGHTDKTAQRIDQRRQR